MPLKSMAYKEEPNFATLGELPEFRAAFAQKSRFFNSLGANPVSKWDGLRAVRSLSMPVWVAELLNRILPCEPLWPSWFQLLKSSTTMDTKEHEGVAIRTVSFIRRA